MRDYSLRVRKVFLLLVPFQMGEVVAVVVDAEFGGEVDLDIGLRKSGGDLCFEVMACGPDGVYEDLDTL